MAKTKQTRKQKRLENKKRKMSAHLDICKLNDKDRKLQKLKKIENDISDEPDSKRVKKEFEQNDTNGFNVGRAGKPLLVGEEYEELKRQMRERRKAMKSISVFRLRDAGEDAKLSLPTDDRTPIFLSDIQHLLLFCQLGNYASFTPDRWCHLEKYSKLATTFVLVVENLSLHNYTANADKFPNLTTLLKYQLDVITPSVYSGDLVEELIAVPLTSTQKKNIVDEYGCLPEAVKSHQVFTMIKAVFPVEHRVKFLNDQNLELPTGDKFSRTRLLLSAWQMVEENYPLPLKGPLKYRYQDYVLSKDVYDEVTHTSPLYAVDCEMCLTTANLNELTRVSVVSESHELVYESFVKPYNKIINYLTQYSGITPAMLQNVTTRIEDVQRDLRELLPPDAILVGQSLNSDFHALKMMHPYVIDTSTIFNLTGDRIRKTKLKILAKEFLDMTIQNHATGHDSIEDSLASLKLVQLKLENYVEFGDAILSGQHAVLRDYRLLGDNYYGSSLLHHVTKHDNTCQIIAQSGDMKKYQKYIHHQKKDSCRNIKCLVRESSKLIEKEMLESCGKTNLTFAHLQINEADKIEDEMDSTCEKVDKMVKNLWDRLPNNTLFIVLFGGENKGNGCCFIDIKKQKLNIGMSL